MSQAEYQCVEEPQGSTCSADCVSLEACEECGCVTVQTDVGGAWGEVMDVIFCLLPIFFLVFATIKRKPLPTTVSLPFAALMMFLIRLMYLGSDPLLTSGSVILGLHEALTPLSIMAGAITLFESMEATYCLPYMMREMKDLTAGHPVAELMLMFSFAYMVEGASGFGTPVALGAPMLVSQGHAAFPAVVVLLIMNTMATVWGAVGTPIWFGFGDLDGIGQPEFLEISQKASIPLAFCSFLLVPLSLTLLMPRSVIWSNWKFILLSLITVVGPSVGIAHVSYEFPSLMGGLVGCGLSAILIRYKIGLRPLSEDQSKALVNQQRKSMLLAGGSNNDAAAGISDMGSLSPHPSQAEDSQKQKQKTEASSVGVGSVQPNDVVVLETDDDEDNDILKKDSTNDTKRSSPEPNDDGDDSPIEMIAPVEEQTLDESTKKVTSNDEENDGTDFDPEGNDGKGLMSPFVVDNQATFLGKTFSDQGDDLAYHLPPAKKWGEGYLWELTWRTFPIWAVVVLLIITRVEQIGIKYYLTLKAPYFTIDFRTYGIFRLSASLVFQLYNILTYPGLNWKYELLYLPFLMPFVLVSAISLFIFRKNLAQSPKQIAKTVAGRLARPAVALLGALVLVQLMIRSGDAAPANILGTILARWFRQGFVVLSPLLGALGSFFSGSTTVSNLTFGDIQMIAAKSINTSVTSMLALQAVGASAGNGICLNNIIAACAVVGLDVGEGKILIQTYKFVFTSTTISTIVILAFFMRFG